MDHIIFPPKEELADDKSASTPTYTFSNVSPVLNSGSISASGVTLTTGTSFSWPYVNTNNPWLGNGITNDPAGTGRLKLTGQGADVEINGKSLSKTIQALEQRLNMLVPNPELETEWEELRKLGEQYRALEAKLTEQGEMWAKLKAMPPPEIE
jgi:hypothetical protein